MLRIRICLVVNSRKQKENGMRVRAQELITDNRGGLLAGTVQARWPAHS